MENKLKLKIVDKYQLDLSDLSKNQTSDKKYEEEVNKRLSQLNIIGPYYLVYDTDGVIIAVESKDSYDLEIDISQHRIVEDPSELYGNLRYFKSKHDKRDRNKWDITKCDEEKCIHYISKAY